MKTLVVVGTLGVAVAAAGLIVLGRPSEPATPAAAVEEDVPLAPAGSDTETRIAALERTVSALQRRVRELESAAAARPPVAGQAEGGGAPVAAASPEIKDAVRAAQEEIRAEQRAEREARREEMMRRRAEERAAAFSKFVADAQLDTTTATKVQALLAQEETARRDLIETARASGDGMRDARQKARELRDRTDAEVGKMLTDSQKTLYLEMRGTDRGMIGGPGGGPPGRD